MKCKKQTSVILGLYKNVMYKAVTLESFKYLIFSTKSWRGFVDKTEAKLEPGIVQQYSAIVYSSKDDLYTN